VIDTLALARELFPGKRNSLDALCERFSVDNAQRTVHGALLDAQLLADVYLTMTRGQETLTIDMAPPPRVLLDPRGAAIDLAAARKTVGAIAPSAEELELHRQYLSCWRRNRQGVACGSRSKRSRARRRATARRGLVQAYTMAVDYLKKILTARVYDVAMESPLELAPALSRRLSNSVLLKREDQQSVFSFKLRGAYNKMAHLSPPRARAGSDHRLRGNHAQGVALASQKLNCAATIVVPGHHAHIKIAAIEARGAKVVLHGDSYSDAYAHALALQKQSHAVFVHPYDDPDVIAGQGTIGMEILRQCQGRSTRSSSRSAAAGSSAASRRT
jgi:hypothetical protein